MKKTLLVIFFALLSFAANAQEQKRADIKFEKTTIDLGKFGRETPIRKCAFVFTNTGDADLYIHQSFTSCGCTASRIPERAIKPGEKDSITVTYDGRRRTPGKMRKSITIHNNSKDEMIKLYITGNMLPIKEKEIEAVEVEE